MRQKLADFLDMDTDIVIDMDRNTDMDTDIDMDRGTDMDMENFQEHQ
jgi:hypothetical protein